MRRWKNGLAEERLSFIEKKQLMKIRARKPFLITFCNLHMRGLSSCQNYSWLWQTIIAFFFKKLISIPFAFNIWRFASLRNRSRGDVGPWFVLRHQERIKSGLLYSIRKGAHFLEPKLKWAYEQFPVIGPPSYGQPLSDPIALTPHLRV